MRNPENSGLNAPSFNQAATGQLSEDEGIFHSQEADIFDQQAYNQQ
jgi:hypothetical protein